MNDTTQDEQAAATPGAPVRTVVLPRSCTQAQGGELKAELLASLADGRPVVLDGSEVDRVDVSGVQLLVAFSVDCMEKGVQFTWHSRSRELGEAIRVAGVGALLESPGIAISF